MGGSLSHITRRFLVDPDAARRDLVTPVLVLEAPPLDLQDDLLLGTEVGAHDRPRAGEGMLFRVDKRTTNAFPMGVAVGRTENNDIVLADNSVSRFHAWFQKDRNGQWSLTDADSTGGTFVGGNRLQPQKPMVLSDHARVRFGGIELFFFLPASFFEYLQGHVRP